MQQGRYPMIPARQPPNPDKLLESLILWLNGDQFGAIIRPYGEETIVMVLDYKRTIKQIKAMWPRATHSSAPAPSPIEETLEHQHDQYRQHPMDIIPDISGLQTFPFRCCSKCNDHEPTCHDEGGAYKDEHDVAIRKAEREKVFEWAKKHNWPTTGGHRVIGFDKLKEFLESLRGGGAP